MSKEVQVISGKMRQEFSLDEKKRIVSESYASDLSLTRFARQVGISAPTLCVWRKRFKGQVRETSWSEPTPMSLEDVLAENHALKQEVQTLKSDVFKLKAFVGHKVFELECRNV